jgi:hypothetical protein
MLGAGWQATYSSGAEQQGWVSFGSRLVLFIDPRDELHTTAWAHAAHLAVGYDFGGGGIGLRVLWAPDDRILFDTTGAPLFSAMVTLETRPGGYWTPPKDEK